MTTLTGVRLDLTQTVASVLGGIPVFAYWPNNVSAPCAVVELGAGTQNKRGRWASTWRITLVGPAGDNQAAAEWVEAMIIQVAGAVSEQFTAPVSWERPVATQYAGSTYYAGTALVTLDLEPDPT